MDKQTIQKKYIDYVLDKGEKPKNVYMFAKQIKITESDFYAFYGSFDAIEKDFWLTIFNEVKEKLEKDTTYATYSAKEQILAFYFMWTQQMRAYRSYIHSMSGEKPWEGMKAMHENMEPFKQSFLQYADELIQNGVSGQQIKERMYLTERYKHVFWIQTLFVLNYWLKDDSANFEMTDAAIEKAVNMIFKLISDNAVDSVIDFGKFLFQKAV